MNKAFKARLNPDQSTQVVNLLRSDGALLSRIGLTPTPERLQSLIDNNSTIAEYCMTKLISSKHASEYLNTLISLQLSLQSMELVNKLTAYNLPKDILHSYISNILHSTRTATDKALQTRHVRLVCVFLQSLIRNKTVTEQELYYESRIGLDTQDFCVEFAKVKEANILHRLLRQVDPNDSSSGSGGAFPENNDFAALATTGSMVMGTDKPQQP
jgi:hypothetical protein